MKVKEVKRLLDLLPDEADLEATMYPGMFHIDLGNKVFFAVDFDQDDYVDAKEDLEIKIARIQDTKEWNRLLSK